MKLTLSTGPILLQGDVTLPDDLLWTDEFTWVKAGQARSRALQGSLIIETSTALAGRPISLSAKDDMAWIPRSMLERLYAWASLENTELLLTFEYPDDVRTFSVMFDQQASPIEAAPVKGFPAHSQEDWFTVKLKFIEV
jgi:hypothetical protein